MSDKTDTAQKPKKGKGLLIKLVGGLVLIAAGGGVAAGATRTPLAGPSEGTVMAGSGADESMTV